MGETSGVIVLDTMMLGMPEVTAAYLLPGPRPAIVDVGPQTSAAAVRSGLARHGVGPGDLAWIVLTHIHLDHCGAAGDLARDHPDAKVVVHPRGARHLAEPERLVTASHAVYGAHAPGYGGLDPVAQESILPVEDGDLVHLGGGRALRALHTPGHARHHIAFHDAATGLVLAGDAVGVRLRGGRPYPALPPPDIDIEAGRRSLARLADLDPATVAVGHFGIIDHEPVAEMERLSGVLESIGRAARRGWSVFGDVAGVAAAMEEDVPGAEAAGPEAVKLLDHLGWRDNDAAGMADWARRTGEREATAR